MVKHQSKWTYIILGKFECFMEHVHNPNQHTAVYLWQLTIHQNVCQQSNQTNSELLTNACVTSITSQHTVSLNKYAESLYIFFNEYKCTDLRAFHDNRNYYITSQTSHLSNCHLSAKCPACSQVKRLILILFIINVISD